MALPNARNQYLKTQVETASKEQLVVMLFDGIIRFTEQARKAMSEGGIEDSHHALMRAQAIIMELICTIDRDKGGEVANNMMSLHAYAFNCLIICNMKKDVTKIDEVQKIYRELREAWVGAMDSLGINSTAGKTDAATTSASGRPAGDSGSAAPSSSASVLVAGKTRLSVPAPVLNAAPPPAPVPASPKASGYGMGRTAGIKAAPPPATAGDAIITPVAAKHTAMLNAYGSGIRSIA